MSPDRGSILGGVKLALLLLLLLGALRGGATSVAKYVSINDVPPIGYAMWQSLTAATILTLLSVARSRHLPDIFSRPGYFLVCGVIGTAIPNCLFFLAVRHIAAGTMVVILTLGPIMTYAMAVALKTERADRVRLFGIGLGMTGALLIALPRVDDVGFNVYLLLALLCPLGYSIIGVYVARRNVTGIEPYHLAAGTQIVSAAFLTPLALASGQFYPIWADISTEALLIVFHGTVAAIAFTLFFKIVELAGAVFYSYSSYVIAATGIGWGMLIFDERHGPVFGVAVLLIFAGLAVINARTART